MKFRAKRLLKKDYDVMAPEGLWWMKGKTIDPTRPDRWLWSLMVIVPDLDDKLFSKTVEEARHKRNPPGLEKARLETFEEGQCVQICTSAPTRPSRSQSGRWKPAPGRTAASWSASTTRST